MSPACDAKIIKKKRTLALLCYSFTSKATLITALYSTICPLSTCAFQLVTSTPLIFRIVLLARSSFFSRASCQLLSDVDIKSET